MYKGAVAVLLYYIHFNILYRVDFHMSFIRMVRAPI